MIVVTNNIPASSTSNFATEEYEDSHASGWIQKDLIKQSFRHFVQHVNPAEADRILLMLDGH
jgi:hypothetical protein